MLASSSIHHWCQVPFLLVFCRAVVCGNHYYRDDYWPQWRTLLDFYPLKMPPAVQVLCHATRSAYISPNIRSHEAISERENDGSGSHTCFLFPYVCSLRWVDVRDCYLLHHTRLLCGLKGNLARDPIIGRRQMGKQRYGQIHSLHTHCDTTRVNLRDHRICRFSSSVGTTCGRLHDDSLEENFA